MDDFEKLRAVLRRLRSVPRSKDDLLGHYAGDMQIRQIEWDGSRATSFPITPPTPVDRPLYPICPDALARLKLSLMSNEDLRRIEQLLTEGRMTFETPRQKPVFRLVGEDEETKEKR